MLKHRFSWLALMAAFICIGSAQDAFSRGGEAGEGAAREERPAPEAQRPAPQASAPRALVINMGRGASGARSRNFPGSAPQSASRPQPSYGHLERQVMAPEPAPQPQPRPVQSEHRTRQQAATVQAEPVRRAPVPLTQRSVQAFASAGVRAANASHHHPYTPGYVRQKLQKLGVSEEPAFITDRSEFMQTDRQHSTMTYPKLGPDRQPIKASLVSPSHLSDPAVRNHMALMSGDDWQGTVDQLNRTETKPGKYYWHQSPTQFSYCHYVDKSGYQWYGWYLGQQYFWTRNFNGRWWCYDSDRDRWCFFNSNFWWWQDPNHVGDLYCYNGDSYIPCNSQEDQLVVTQPTSDDEKSYPSPDGTRIVKVAGDSQDAFLYDAASPASFDPIYLASGVQDVEFSNTSNGRPLEIILKLNDGSFDMVDAQGNSYGPGAMDADQAASLSQNP